MADFSTTKGDITLSGSYRFNPEEHKLTEINFNGNVNSETYFNGNINAAGQVNIYGVGLSDIASVGAALAELHEGIIAKIALDAAED